MRLRVYCQNCTGARDVVAGDELEQLIERRVLRHDDRGRLYEVCEQCTAAALLFRDSMTDDGRHDVAGRLGALEERVLELARRVSELEVPRSPAPAKSVAGELRCGDCGRCAECSHLHYFERGR